MTGLGILDTLGIGSGIGSCRVVVGTLGEATSSKTSLVGVACWKGVTCASCTGVHGTVAGIKGCDHVEAPDVSSSCRLPGHEKGCWYDLELGCIGEAAR
jgi:hypothetical protein